MPYPLFDRSKLRLRPLGERIHDVTVAELRGLSDALSQYDHPDLVEVARRMADASRGGRPVIWMMGAHPDSYPL